MIRVIDDLYIDVDERNYTAKKDLHTVSVDKDGIEHENYLTIGYYSTLAGAIKGIKNYCVRKSLSNEFESLESAVRTLREVNNEFEAILKETVNG